MGAGQAEGYHSSIDADTDPVYIIVAEGRTVGDLVRNCLDRCTRKYQLFTSSPGPDSDQFYPAHSSDATFFTTFKVTSCDCPHIDRAKIERDREKYGSDHPDLLRLLHAREGGRDTTQSVEGAFSEVLTAVVQFCEHYHWEQNHQEVGNSIIEPKFTSPSDGSVECRKRLGGLLRYDYREAA